MLTSAAVHSLSAPTHPYEDRYRLLGNSHPHVRSAGRGHVYAVMDGVGGAPMGMHAAQLVADRVAEFFVRPEIPPTSEGMNTLLLDINAEAHAWGMIEGTDRPRAATAATVAWFHPERRKLHVFHVGDTMALHFDGETLRRITREHGTGRAIHRYVGQGAGFLLDRHEVPFEEGEVLCLVTDGVTKALSIHDVGNVLEELSDPERAAREIVVRARIRGSRDDITALVVELEEW
jgi:serine/threonine protein phosphatase PrpC